MIRINKYLPYSAVILFLIFCNKPDQKNVVARVGKSTLTLEDLKKNIPAEYSNEFSREQNINFVKQWIDRELLYQEALNQNVDKDPFIIDRLKKIKKDLLSAEMLNRYSMKFQADSINDSIIINYYDQNKDQFIRQNDLIKYYDLRINDSKTAWDLYRSLTKDNYFNIVSQFLKTDIIDLSNLPYIKTEDIPEDIRNNLINMAVNTISRPIKISDDYHIFYYIDKLQKGNICSISEVKKDIIDQLVTINQKAFIEKILSDLRLNTQVDFDVNLLEDSLNKRIF